MIRAMIFDLGKVVLDFDHWIICERLADLSGFNKEYVYDLIFTSGLEREYDEGKITSRDFYAHITIKLNLHIDYSTFYPLWCDIFSLKDDMIPLLKSLRNHYKLLLLSNTNEMHFEFVRGKFPVLDVFDEFILSYNLGIRKPDRKIYEKAIEASNCSRDECLFIDDILENVEMARECGMTGIHFKNSQTLRVEFNKLRINYE